MSHLHEHFFHDLIILVPGFILVLYLLKDKLQFKSFKLIIILLISLFAVFHLAPVTTLHIYEHQQADLGNHHPCCIPQVAVETPVFIVPELPQLSFDNRVVQITSLFNPPTFTLNSRAPPFQTV